VAFREVDWRHADWREVDWEEADLPVGEPAVVMLDDASEPGGDALSLRSLWGRVPAPRVVVPAVLVAALLGGVVGAVVTRATDRPGAAGISRSSLEIRLDVEALREGLDVYGLLRPALPLQITNLDRNALRVAQLTYASQGGRLIWYGDADAVGPGQHARIWGESEISCGAEGEHVTGLFAYVLLPDGSNRTVQLTEPGSLAVFSETLQRACG